MTGRHNQSSDVARTARNTQASLYSYLREQSKRTSDKRQQKIANLSAKHIQQHLHRRTPTG